MDGNSSISKKYDEEADNEIFSGDKVQDSRPQIAIVILGVNDAFLTS